MSKPKLGETIYFIYENWDIVALYRLNVYMIGKGCFAHSMAFNWDSCDDFKKPLLFRQEHTRWFRTFEEAKSKLEKRYSSEWKLVEVSDGYWEIR